MPFQNSILAGEDLVRTGIRSPNFLTGVTGWRIARNGDAEFNDVLLRGALRTAAPPGQRIEIGTTSTNLIEFYTGDVDEEGPGFIHSGIVSSGPSRRAQLDLRAPVLVDPDTGEFAAPYIQLIDEAADDSIPPRVNIYADLDNSIQLKTDDLRLFVAGDARVVLTDSPHRCELNSDELQVSANVAKTITATTDASGFITFTHGASVTPKICLIEVQAPISGAPSLPYQHMVDTYGATTARVRFLDQFGAVFASTSVTFRVLTLI